MRIRAAFATLLAAAALQAQISNELAVSDVSYVHNIEPVRAAGSDGDDFLVAGVRSGTVYAHRLTAGGELPDGTGIRIEIAPRYFVRTVLGVFWAGDAYTIVIASVDTTPYAAGTPIHVARISADGRLIVPAHLVAITSNGYDDQAASNGRRIVVAGSKLTVLDMDGTLVENDVPMPVEPGASLIGYCSIASNGDGFLVSWDSSPPGQTHVAIAPLDKNGHPTTAVPSVVVTGIGFTNAVASDGNDYVVIYQTADGTHHAQHVSASGAMLEPSVLPRLGTQITRILWSGTSYIVGALNTVSGSFAIATPTALRLDRTGASTSPAIQSIDPSSVVTYTDNPVMASNGRQLAMFWPEGLNDPTPRWFGAFLGSDLTVAAKFPIGITATPQLAPSLATDGRNLFTVWEEGSAIYGTLSSPATGQHGARIKLSTAAGHAPRAIWDGHAYAVAWLSGSTPVLTTAQVSADGTIAQAAEKAVFPGCVDAFDLAVDGSESVLAVATACFGASKGLLAARVHRDGSAEPPVTFATSAGFPRLAWNGTEFLLAWWQITNTSGLDYPIYRGDIRATRLSPSLTMLDPATLAIDVEANGENSRPVVASDGRDFLVAWTREDQNDPSARARSVSADGAMGDLLELGPGPANSLVWSGSRFLIARTTPTAEILLTRIGTGGASLLTANAALLPNGIGSVPLKVNSAAALVPLGQELAAAAYLRNGTEPLYGGVPRVFLKTVGGLRTRPAR